MAYMKFRLGSAVLVENSTVIDMVRGVWTNHSRVPLGGNRSIDVILEGCYRDNFSTIACARNGFLSLLVVFTGLLCVWKVCKLHGNRHPTMHQYSIFYCATCECILCSVHWLIGLYTQMDFIAQYLKLLQFLVVSHFYWLLATRSLRKDQESFTQRLLWPLYGCAFLYFTVIVILGCVRVRSTWTECFQPYWLLLSMGEFVLVQLFMIAGIYITRRLNEISTLDSIRRTQKRDLWSLVMAFGMSSLASLIYDATLRTLADEQIGCSGVFLHRQEFYSSVFGIFLVVKFLVPIWAMLFVFHPLETSGDREDLLPPVSEEGTYTSVFTPPYDTRHRYKPLFQPGSEGLTPESDFTPSPNSGASTPVFGPLTRTTSTLMTIREESGEPDGAEAVEDNDRRPIIS